MKSPVEWMSVLPRTVVEEVDLLLMQVFGCTLSVCVQRVFVPFVLLLQLHRRTETHEGQTGGPYCLRCTRSVEC